MDILGYGAAGLVGALIDHLFIKLREKKTKLIYYIHNVSYFNLNIPGQQALTTNTTPPREIPLCSYSIFIRNIGNLPAHNIVVKHMRIPKYFTMLPTETKCVDDRKNGTITIDLIRPKEEIAISYLEDELAAYKYEDIYKTTVRSDEGFAKPTPVMLSPILPKNVIVLIQIVFLLGILFVIFLFYKALPFISKMCSIIVSHIIK